MRIRYRHLHTFSRVSRIGSILRAAEDLGVTQPAVSKTLRELEEELGASLLQRSRRGVSLTPYGEIFLGYAEASLGALRQGVDSVSRARREGDGLVRLGILPTVSGDLIPRAVRAFKETGHLDRVRVTTGENTVLIDQLRQGDLDVVVGRLGDPGQMVGLTFEHLYSERVVFTVRKDHPLAAGRDFSLAAISDYTVLFPPDTAVIRPWVDRLLVTHQVARPVDVVETVSTAFGKAYTLANDAVWIISHGVVAQDVAAGDLVILPVDTNETVGPVGITLRVSDPPSAAVSQMIAVIREAAETQTT
ncbi:pca operon transcription factor PcaQ [Rhodospirillaceae bacterium KN72]|uniref:Pca operon transcription factor PcaQ n=1 Tax=Pacificispira spongiicola TaxID=2729598 RepID=A0A7Y0HH14_9PROT|nr:pca operon transcription factor PcaQ [Pacificispira spongiicola]NMM45487.1 pca operon transcription factor PcaQ [Pacificispira spongiicola]